MCKILTRLIAIFFILCNTLYSQYVLSDIKIPSSYEELKVLYIKAVQMYYKESDAHRQTLDLVKSLETQNSNLRRELNNIVTNGNFSRPMREHFVSVNIGSFYKDDSSSLGFGLSYFYLLDERWILGIDALFPFFLGAKIGMGF